MRHCHTVVVDGSRDLCFSGNLIAEFETILLCNDDYEPQEDRMQLRLYQTDSGTFICESITRCVDSRENYDGCFVYDLKGVTAFFGSSQEAKELYKQADITYLQEIE